MTMSDFERETRLNFKNDFLFYAQKCLKIRTKNGSLENLNLNDAQHYIHTRAEEQKKDKGFIRVIILKGRQQGCSTYISGRFYHQITHKMGARAFILTHEQKATDNLFEMASRYHDNCPDPLKPTASTSNAKELFFGGLDSGYSVGTAGNKAVGRSATIQYLHGSEVAYWPNAEEHLAGILQAVPRETDTEVWLESTADGPNNMYHKIWIQAERGEGDFIPIFIPWFWQREYAIEGDIKLDADEQDYKLAYKLTDAQMLWRRLKILELGGADDGLKRFKREYPANPAEAFEQREMCAVIPSQSVAASINNTTPVNDRLRVVWGIDPAGEGKDRSALSKRRANHKLGKTITWQGLDATQLCGRIVEEYRATPEIDKPAEIFIDNIGIGYGVYCRLRELGLPAIGINWGKPAIDNKRFHILKDELHWRAREWFLNGTAVIEDEPIFVAEISCLLYDRSSDGRIFVEDKKSLKRRGIRSPDLSDSFIYTFAGGMIEVDDRTMDRYARRLYDNNRDSGSWMTA